MRLRETRKRMTSHLPGRSVRPDSSASGTANQHRGRIARAVSDRAAKRRTGQTADYRVGIRVIRATGCSNKRTKGGGKHDLGFGHQEALLSFFIAV
jgi:hypothetical protein